MNKFYGFCFVLVLVLGFSTSASAQVESAEGCVKYGNAGEARTACDVGVLIWLQSQLEAASKVCDLALRPDQCTETQIGKITKLVVNVQEKGMTPYNLDNDHNVRACAWEGDSLNDQYQRLRCEIQRDYHKIEDKLAAEIEIRRKRESRASAPPKVRTIEESPKPRARSRASQVPDSFWGDDDSSKRPSKDADDEPARQDCRYKGHPIRDGQAIKDEIGCNDCTCNDGVVICTLMDCDDGEDKAFQPSPRRPAPPRDYVEGGNIPVPVGYATSVVASTVKPTDGSLSLYVENTQRIFDGVRNSFSGTNSSVPFMVCASFDGQPLNVVQISGGYFRSYKIAANIGSGTQLYDCVPSGATIYVSGMEPGKVVLLHYVAITNKVVPTGAGPMRTYKLMETRAYRSASVPIRSEYQYRFQAIMGGRR